MGLEHPEYLFIMLLPALIVLITAVIVIKKWGPEKSEDKKN